uniref:Retrotransposon gag domain-containing protein n=1 Tax=Rhodnius prolixus TaxID=13249 RepID=T1HR75_RHOPR
MAIEALEEHFQPKVNVTYERHVFRGMRQEREENMNNFIARLRKQAQNCDFQKQVEDQIKDQVISACYSSELRREFLHKSEITLAEIEKLSKTFEAVAIHSKALDGEEAQCNRVIMKRPQKKFYK